MHHLDFSSQLARTEILARLERAREFRRVGDGLRNRHRCGLTRPTVR